jgi:hypothetical protein
MKNAKKDCVIICIAIIFMGIYGTVYSANGQYAPGQEPTSEQVALQCTKYNTEILKIVTMAVDECSSAGDAIAHWLSTGYKIASVGDGYVFMTK